MRKSQNSHLETILSLDSGLYWKEKWPVICYKWSCPQGPSIYYVRIILDFFWPTHPLCINIVLNGQQNCQFSRSTHPDVIYGWSLTAMFVIVSWISFLMPLDRGAFNKFVDQTFTDFWPPTHLKWAFYMPSKYSLSTLTFYDLGRNKFWKSGDVGGTYTSNVVGISNLPKCPPKLR